MRLEALSVFDFITNPNSHVAYIMCRDNKWQIENTDKWINFLRYSASSEFELRLRFLFFLVGKIDSIGNSVIHFIKDDNSFYLGVSQKIDLSSSDVEWIMRTILDFLQCKYGQEMANASISEIYKYIDDLIEFINVVTTMQIEETPQLLELGLVNGSNHDSLSKKPALAKS